MPLSESKSYKLLRHFFRKYLILPCRIFYVATVDTIKQDGVEHAGYLAFLSIFSLFPFLILLISIVGFIGASDAGAQVITAVLAAVPKEMADALTPRIHEIISGPPQSFLTIAIIGVIWTASSAVEGCRTILNRAYRVALPPPYILRRLISIAEFFAITFVMVAAIFFFVVVPNMLENLDHSVVVKYYMSEKGYALRHLLILITLTITTSLLYYVIPNAKQKITQTLPGSILAVALWVLLEKCLSFYLDNFHQFNFVYGSLAGMIVSLMFFYLIALVFIFGAEFNYHFHRIYQVLLKD